MKPAEDPDEDDFSDVDFDDEDSEDPAPAKKPIGNPNIRNIGKKFTSEDNITPEQRLKSAETLKKKTKKKRELLELLNIKLKGSGGEMVQKKFEEIFGVKPRTLEEALHFSQVIKGITDKDTYAYSALMQGAGLNKPIKIDTTSGGKPLQNAIDYSKMTTEDLLKLKEINERYAT